MHALFPLFLAAAAPGPQPSLLVLPVQAKTNVSSDVAELVTQLVAVEAAKRSGMRVMTVLEVEGLMSQEQKKQVAGCDALGCAAEIAGALNADQLIMGAVGRVGDQYVISLTRVQGRNAEVIARAVEQVAATNEASVLPAVAAVTASLFKDATPGPVAPVVVERPPERTMAPAVEAATEAPTSGRARPWKWVALASFGGAAAWMGLALVGAAGTAAAGGVMAYDRWAELPPAADHVVPQPVGFASNVGIVGAPIIGVAAFVLALASAVVGIGFVVISFV